MPILPSADTMQVATPQPTQGVVGYNSQAISQAVSSVAQDAQAMLAHYNGLRVQDAANQLTQAQLDLTDGEGGYTHLHGSDAATQPLGDIYKQKYQSAIEQINSTLSNAQQRQAFKQFSAQRQTEFVAGVLQHQSREADVYQKQVLVGTLTTSHDAATRSWENPAEVESNRQTGIAAIQANGAHLGLPQQEIQAQIDEYTSNLNAGVVESSLAAGDYKTADAYMEKFKGQIAPNESGILANKIDEYRAPDLAQAIYGKHGGDLHASLKDAMGIERAGLRNSVNRLIREQWSLDQANVRENFFETQQSAAEAVTALQEGTNLTPAVQGQIDQTRRQLQSIAGANSAMGREASKTLQRLDTAVTASQLTAQMGAMPLSQQADLVNQHIAAVGQAGTLEDAARARDVAQFMASAYQRNERAITTDPYGTYAKQTGTQVAPLDPSKPLDQQLQARVPIAAQIAGRWGVNPGLLQPQEAAQIAANLSQMAPEQRVSTLAQLYNVSDQALRDKTIEDFSKSQPLLAQVAQYGLNNRVAPDGQSVAGLIAAGQDMIHGRRDAKGQEVVKPSFKLVEGGSTAFENQFSSAVGNLFANNAAAREIAQQGLLATYAAYAQQNGKALDGKFDSGTFEKARKAYFGSDVATVNGVDVLPPYGMSTSVFKSQLPEAVTTMLKSAGGFSEQQIQSIAKHGMPKNVGNGYILSSVDASGRQGFVTDQNGQPIVFQVNPPPPTDSSMPWQSDLRRLRLEGR